MKSLLLLIFFFLVSYAQSDQIIVIANKNVTISEEKTLSKIYTGKMIMLENTNVIPVNRSDANIRNEFLKQYVHMDDKKYIAYWTVRQYIGKGSSPKKLGSTQEVFNFVKNTQGAVAYITQEELNKHPSGDIKILFKHEDLTHQ